MITFDPKKIFDAAYKKNKLLTCFVCCLSILLLVNVIWTTVYKSLVKINDTKDIVLIHSADLIHIKKGMDEFDELSHSIVTRPSFNSYIKRKDTEYHEQNEFNNNMSSKVGHIEGEISILIREKDAHE